MIGYAPGEIVGRSALEFLPQTEQPILQSVRSQLLEPGASVRVASAVRARDGRIVSVLVDTSKSTFEGRPASIAVIVESASATRLSANWRRPRQFSPPSTKPRLTAS